MIAFRRFRSFQVYILLYSGDGERAIETASMGFWCDEPMRTVVKDYKNKKKEHDAKVLGEKLKQAERDRLEQKILRCEDEKKKLSQTIEKVSKMIAELKAELQENKTQPFDRLSIPSDKIPAILDKISTILGFTESPVSEGELESLLLYLCECVHETGIVEVWKSKLSNEVRDFSEKSADEYLAELL